MARKSAESSLSPVMQCALSACVKSAAEKKAKDGMAPGFNSGEIDFTVRVRGTVSKAFVGIEVANTSALPWTSVLALAMHRAGFHKDKLHALCADVLANNLTTAEQMALATAKKDWEETVKPLLPTRTNEPIVTSSVTAELLEG